jgi:hypothetical protein
MLAYKPTPPPAILLCCKQAYSEATRIDSRRTPFELMAGMDNGIGWLTALPVVRCALIGDIRFTSDLGWDYTYHYAPWEGCAAQAELDTVTASFASRQITLPVGALKVAIKFADGLVWASDPVRTIQKHFTRRAASEGDWLS